MIGVRVREEDRVERRRSWRSACARRSGVVSTSTRMSSSSSTIDGRARALVARIGGPADVAIAADHRHAMRRAGAEEHHAHENTDASMNANGEACTATHWTVDEVARSEASTSRQAGTSSSRRAGAAFARLVRHHGDAAIAARLSVGPRADAGHAAAVPARGDVRSARRDRSRRLRGSPRRTRRRAVSVRVPGADRRRGRAIRHRRRASTRSPPSSSAGTRTCSRRTAGRSRRDAGGAARRRPTAVLEQWEQIKAKEQTAAGAKTRLLAGVPRALPALLRAHEIGTRVAAVGFDWARTADVLDKIDEEVARAARGALDEARRARPRNSATCSSRSRISRASSTSSPSPRCARPTTSSRRASRRSKVTSSARASRSTAPPSTRWRACGRS